MDVKIVKKVTMTSVGVEPGVIASTVSHPKESQDHKKDLLVLYPHARCTDCKWEEMSSEAHKLANEHVQVRQHKVSVMEVKYTWYY